MCEKTKTQIHKMVVMSLTDFNVKRDHDIEIHQCVILYEEAQILTRSLNEKWEIFYKI